VTTIKFGSYHPRGKPIDEHKVKKTRVYYNRSVKMWVTQGLNYKGDVLDRTEYSTSKAEATKKARSMKR